MQSEYRECAERCARIEYCDPASVADSNRAVDRMYEIVKLAVKEGEGAVNKLVSLLDEPVSARWLAHQLVEIADLQRDVEDRCFAIVEELATGDGPEAMGEAVWLKEFKVKKNRA